MPDTLPGCACSDQRSSATSTAAYSTAAPPISSTSTADIAKPFKRGAQLDQQLNEET